MMTSDSVTWPSGSSPKMRVIPPQAVHACAMIAASPVSFSCARLAMTSTERPSERSKRAAT